MNDYSKTLTFPYEIVDVEPKVNDELLQYFKGERTGFVQVGPEKYFFPHKFKLEAHNLYNFQSRADDILVATVPRSGTTWTQELVWLLENNLDFNQAKRQLLTERFAFLESSVFIHPDFIAELLSEHEGDERKQDSIEKFSAPSYKILNEWPCNKKRFIKTHLPFSLLPPSVMQNKCKVIYVARNPEDVAVSYYHLNRLYRTLGYNGDFQRYWNYFSRGLNPWLPYNSHIKEAFEHRHLPNVLILKYEDMVSDLSGVILKLAAFLNHTVSTEDLKNLIQHLDIKNFRENSAVNGSEMAEIGVFSKREAGFVRRGGSGKQEELVSDSILKNCVDQWIDRSMVKTFY